MVAHEIIQIFFTSKFELELCNPECGVLIIDFYQACFGNDGQKGQLCCVIDEKATQIIQKRTKMGIPVELEEDVAHAGNHANRGKQMITAGRASKFVQQNQNMSVSIMEEDPNDEYSYTSETDPDGSSY